MEKVYLVLEKQPYHASFVHGVFTSYSKAQVFQCELIEKGISMDEVWIKEVKLNHGVWE